MKNVPAILKTGHNDYGRGGMRLAYANQKLAAMQIRSRTAAALHDDTKKY